MTESPLIDYESLAAYVVAHEHEARLFEKLTYYFRTTATYWTAVNMFESRTFNAALWQWGIDDAYKLYRLLLAGQMLVEDRPCNLDEFDKPFSDPLVLAIFLLDGDNDTKPYQQVYAAIREVANAANRQRASVAILYEILRLPEVERTAWQFKSKLERWQFASAILEMACALVREDDSPFGTWRVA